MSAKGRRRFLKVGGTAAGALMAGGAGVWAASPRVEMPEVSYPGSEDAHRRVLVAYASKAGSTAEVAAFIARKLADTGLAVDLRRVRSVRSLDAYRVVVAGSAIRAGHWLDEASAFVKGGRLPRLERHRVLGRSPGSRDARYGLTPPLPAGVRARP